MSSAPADDDDLKQTAVVRPSSANGASAPQPPSGPAASSWLPVAPGEVLAGKYQV
jgi:hypothetical protein